MEDLFPIFINVNTQRDFFNGSYKIPSSDSILTNLNDLILVVSVIVTGEAGVNTLIYSTANWDEITKFVESLKVPTK